MGKDVKIDLKELEAFRDKLKALTIDIDEIHRSLAKSIARTLLAKVIKNTPWQTRTLVKGWKIDKITKEGFTYSIGISNNVKYALYVEYGHRTRGGKGWVEGKFMLTNSELELQQNLDKIIQKKLEKIIKKRLGL